MFRSQCLASNSRAHTTEQIHKMFCKKNFALFPRFIRKLFKKILTKPIDQ